MIHEEAIEEEAVSIECGVRENLGESPSTTEVVVEVLSLRKEAGIDPE